MYAFGAAGAIALPMSLMRVFTLPGIAVAGSNELGICRVILPLPFVNGLLVVPPAILGTMVQPSLLGVESCCVVFGTFFVTGLATVLAEFVTITNTAHRT